jgi:eukaryotic-like serine/threonine-protein kinase
VTPERWKRVRELLEEALERSPGDRRAFVAAAAAGDAGLAAEVSRLLDAEEKASDFLETPAAATLAPERLAEETDPPGTRRVGPYVLHEKVGQGGMGRVYRAVRSEGDYRRQVALKIVNRGMNTEFILRRFRNERQILAGLDHPAIASLYDGGTTDDGLPYFAMEYIEGKDLLAWSDAHRLPTGERLALFLQVCSAVAYAHRNLVVHRDLKPSNILVTPDGTPKLLDFGLAKILNSDVSSRTAEVTAMGSRLLTPEYASPEQIRGERITTASDVYSLGVLLYELLTGHRPYKLKTREPAEIARAVCEDEPERPSAAVSRVETVPARDAEGDVTLTPESVAATREGDPVRLRKRLGGDLDTIVLMCLRKEPERRYGSVELLAEDLRRHLDGRPVRARKDTLGYRTGKFVRRNRVYVAAGVLAAASLVIGLGVSLRQTRIARDERARAERRFAQLRRLARTFLFDVHDAISDLPGATKARGLLVKEGLAYLDSLAQEAGDDRALRSELAEAYLRLAQVQSAVGTSNEGDSAAALPSFRKAVDLREALAAGTASGSREEDELAEAQIRYAGFLVKTGDLKAGIEWGRKAVAHREAVLARSPNDARAAARLGTTLQMNAYAISADGAPAEARKLLEQSVRNFEMAAAAPRPEPWLPQGLAWAYADLAETYERTGDSRTALVYLERTRTLDEAILANDPLNIRARLRLVFALSDIGYNLMRLGEDARALDAARRALPIAEALASEDLRNQQARSALGMTKLMLGEILVPAGQPHEAVEHLGAAAAIFEAMTASDPLNAWARVQLGRTYSASGDAWSALVKGSRSGEAPARACGYYRRSADVFSLLKAEGRLPGIEMPRIDEVTARVARCGSKPPAGR